MILVACTGRGGGSVPPWKMMAAEELLFLTFSYIQCFFSRLKNHLHFKLGPSFFPDFWHYRETGMELKIPMSFSRDTQLFFSGKRL